MSDDVKVTFGADASQVTDAARKVEASTAGVEKSVQNLAASIKETATTEEEWLEIQKKLNDAHKDFIAASAAKKASLEQVKQQNKELVQSIHNQITAEEQLKAQQAMQLHLKDAGTHINNTIVQLRRLVALLGVGFSINYFRNLIAGTTSAEDHLYRLAIQTGVSVEKLSSMEVMARSSNVSIDLVAMTMSRLSRQMAEVASGRLPQASAAFAALGMNVKDVKEALDAGKMDEVLKTIAIRLFEIENPAKRAAVMMALGMSRASGAAGNLLPFLKDLAEQEVLVADRTTEGSKAFHDFAGKMVEFNRIIENTKHDFVEGILPALSDVTLAIINYTKEGEKSKDKTSVWGTVIRVMSLGVATLGYTYLQLQNDIAGAIAMTDAFFSFNAPAKMRAVAAVYAAENRRIEESFMKMKGTLMGEVGAPGTGSAPPSGGDVKDKPKGGGRSGDMDVSSKKDERLSKWKNELTDMHLAENEFWKSSTSADLNFWQERLATVGAKGAENVALRRQISMEIFRLEKAAATAADGFVKASFAEQLQEARNNRDEKIKVLKEAAQYAAGLHGEDATQALAAAQAVRAAEMELDDFKRNLAIDRINRELQTNIASEELAVADGRVRLTQGQITASQMIDLEIKTLTTIWALRKAAETETLALAKGDEITQKNVRDKMGQLDEQYFSKLKGLDQRRAADVRNTWNTLLSPITSAIQGSINGMIMGTNTLRKALQNIWVSILGEFLSMLANMVKEWAITMLMKTTLGEAFMGWYKGFKAFLLGTDEAADAASAASSVTKASVAVPAEAAKAGAGAASAVANTPFIGPALAIAAFGAVIATVMGAMKLFSASGGFDVPAGMSPLTQLHEKEMVLPAEQADVIRGMAGGRVGNKGQGDVHLHVNAVDASSVKRLFMNHGPALSDSVRRQVRNFSQVGRRT